MHWLRQRLEDLSPAKLLLIVFVVAVIVRLAFLTTKPHAWTSKLQAGDEPLYHGLAVNLLKGEGYTFEGQPRNYPPPLYPSVIAIAYSVASISPPAARITNVVLGGILCVLVAWWALLLWGKQVSIFSGLIAALYYPFVQLPVYLMTENLYLPLFLAAAMATWLTARSSTSLPEPKPSWLTTTFAGALWSLSALTREIARPISLLVAIWLALRAKWQNALILVVAMFVVGLPWSIRNRVVFQNHAKSIAQQTQAHDSLPLLIRIMPGGLFYMSFGPPGNEPRILGHWNLGSDVQRPNPPKGLSPVERDQWLKAQAWNYIKANPMEAVIARIPRKLVNLLVPFYGTASLPNKVLTTLCYLLLLALSLPAWWRAWRSENTAERYMAELALLVILFTVTFHAIFFGVVRYRYPVDAMLLVFAGKKLSELKWKLPLGTRPSVTTDDFRG